MPFITQPDLTNAEGVVLTAGIVAGADRCAIVLPLATNAEFDANQLCQDAVESFMGVSMPDLVACMSADAYIAFIAADGMQDGRTPHRRDFAPTDNPGTRGAGLVPSQVAALAFYYRDEASAPAASRVRVAKNFIPGLCSADVIRDLLVDDLFAAVQTLTLHLQNGIASVSGEVGKKWFRYLAVPKDRTTDVHLIPTFVVGSRQYVATQRRRLIPH